ncbi:MAG: asparaginase [Planctomycetia bacterium]|nr:asparaginase [Planctomycetia bacterium]
MSLRILITGGTFDKYYDAIRGELTFRESHLPAILKQARVTLPIIIEVCLLKDSLHMNDEDRQRILKACQNAPEEAVVVVHGTDTMVETAKLLGEAQLAKTIIMTGAMVPYAITESDSLFNLGFALAAAQCACHGVYVAMNGQVWPWNQVRKNRQLGLFESL